MAKKNNIDELKNQEASITKTDINPNSKAAIDNKKEKNPIIKDRTANILDGYKPIMNEELPQQGKFYPESWNFAYRCPESLEVANFSTIQDNDQTGMIQAVEDLIRKCVIVYDSDKDKLVSTGEILDGHRQFFLLKIREFYLIKNKIEYTAMCSFCHEAMNINLVATKLLYKDFSQELYNVFDGRNFLFPVENNSEGEEREPINFRVPTLNTSSKILKYMMKTYKDNSSDRDNKEEKIIYDKKFLLLAPYLFVDGNENVKGIIEKYKRLKKDSLLLQEYIEIINKLKLDQYDYIENKCEHCESVEEAPVRFPGGWKNLFIGKTKISELFN